MCVLKTKTSFFPFIFQGNNSTHVILRGASSGPNYEAKYVKSTAEKLSKAGLPQRIMIDCSHGNSQKKHERQAIVAADVVSFNTRSRMIHSDVRYKKSLNAYTLALLFPRQDNWAMKRLLLLLLVL